ncbi:hypothetical protein BV900_15105 [Agrobacterium tumefaciens]|nr:hypothetical protein BV900_15105 [Agrobacterium tumefaciens]
MLFYNPNFDRNRYVLDMAVETPERQYVIFFTPRSGSTWLADILDRTAKLGNPREWFNPNFISAHSKDLNAKDLPSYVNLLLRKRSCGGTFGVEVTYFQVVRTMGCINRLFDFFPTDVPVFFLLREDIVAQAVSLSKAFRTGLFHSPGIRPSKMREADSSFTYDADNIIKWIYHLRALEVRTETIFRAFSARPQHLTYEGITSQPPSRLIDGFARKLGIDVPNGRGEVPRYQKIGSSRNVEFAERFRAENRLLLDRIDDARFPLIERSKMTQSNFFEAAVSAPADGGSN